MKNHDMSHHEQRLQANCEGLRNKARKVFGPRGHIGVSLTLTSKEYPESQSIWEAIEKAIEVWPELTRLQEQQVAPGVHLFVAPLLQDGTFAEGFFSDNFAAIIPFHKNEQPNFMQKLNEAVAKLKKGCADKTGKKAIFMRLHQTANMHQMNQFATSLIKEPGCEADLIALYQPAYVSDPKLDTTTPTQYLTFIPSSTWKPTDYPLHMRPVIGQQLTNPSKQKLNWPDGTLKDVPADHYLYSVGWHFVQTKLNSAGEGTVDLRRRPNLSFFPVFNGNVVTGLFPPNDEFLVL
jgi:hypothetical protein